MEWVIVGLLVTNLLAMGALFHFVHDVEERIISGGKVLISTQARVDDVRGEVRSLTEAVERLRSW